MSFRDLASVDLFEEVDQKIISDLARAAAEQAVTFREVAEIVRKRQSSLWLDGYKKLYAAIATGSELLTELASLNLAAQSFDEALDRYRREWFRIDQLYRQFTFAARTAEYPKPLEALREQVEKRYTNTFLYALGNAWQKQVDAVGTWTSSVLRPQAAFFRDYIEPLVRDGDKKAVVIISDALRYEVAEELGSLIRKEDRFDASRRRPRSATELYTAGMAALLPHSTLKHSADGKTVLVDDQPTNGTVLRGKILRRWAERRSRRTSKPLSGDERRELFKANRVLYLYHNRIDATGDKPGTERQVFEAAEDTLRDIVDLVKKLASANATNIFITADHGFLFQDDALPESFFLSTKPHGDDIKVENRPPPCTGARVEGRRRLRDIQLRTGWSRKRPTDSDPQVDPPASPRRRRSPLCPRRRRASGNRRPGPDGQQETQERHPSGQCRGVAGIRQDHHRPSRRPHVPNPNRSATRSSPAPSVPASTSVRP